ASGGSKGAALLRRHGSLVEPLFCEPRRQMVRNLDIVRIREREVRITLDPDLRQLYDGHVPTVLVDRRGQLVCHLYRGMPVVLSGIVSSRLRNEVPKVKNDGESNQFLELVHRHAV